MNNCHVRTAASQLFGDTLSSYSLKVTSMLLYRFETKSSEETLSLLAAIDAHRRTYPPEIVYLQIYGIDSGYENTGAVIIIGTKGVPTNSPLFASPLNISVERA